MKPTRNPRNQWKQRNLANLLEHEIIKSYETNEAIEPLKPFNSFTYEFSRDEQTIA